MQKKLLLLLFILFNFVGISLAQVDSTDAIPPGEYKIVDVEVLGTDQYSPTQIMRYTGLYVGKTISVPGNDINNAIKKLWRQNRFSDVVIYAMEAKDGNIKLGVEVKPLPRVNKVIVEGIPKGKIDKFKKDYKIDEVTRASDSYKNRVTNQIRSYYSKKGRPDAKVTFKSKPEDNYSEELTIVVDPGPRVKVSKINVEGNQEFADSKLKQKMKEVKEIKPYRVWKPSRLDKDHLKEDLESVEDYMKSEGFRDAKVLGYDIRRDESNNYVLDVDVDEGKRYYLGDVEYAGNSVYTSDQLNSYFSYEKGDPYDAIGISKKVSGSDKSDDIWSLYLDSGYLFSNIEMIEKSVENDTINLEIRIQEGALARWNKVTFDGNTTTHDHVIQRSLRTLPGELFSKSAIQRTYYELGGKGYFEPSELQYDMNQNPENNTVDINWKLSEKSSSSVQLQGGYGGNSFVGTLGFTFNNFSAGNLLKGRWKGVVPQGDGQSFSVNGQVGRNFTSFNTSFTEPWIGGKRPTSLSLSFYATFLNYDTANEPSRLKIIGTSVSTNTILNWPDDYFRVGQGLTYQQYKYTNYGFRAGNQILNNGTSNNFAYFFNFGRYSSGTNPIFPTQGSEFELGVKLTPPYSYLNNKDYSTISINDKYKWIEYYKIKTKLYWYKEIIGKMVIKAGAEFGFMTAYNRKVGAPPFERFYMGGTGLGTNRFDGREIIPLRGYQDASVNGGDPNYDITPLGGGNVYDKFLFELRYPITIGQAATIYGLGFFEGGNTWNGFRDFSPFELKRSAGLGIRIFMPQFGLLGFDFGYGFDKPLFGIEPSGWQTHFIFGQNL